MRSKAVVLFLGVCLLALAAPGIGQQSAAPTAEQFEAIAFRSIGPGLVTGRIADIEIDPNDDNTWYIAAAFGGLWKTVNRGISFEPIFDDGGSFTLTSGDLTDHPIPASTIVTPVGAAIEAFAKTATATEHDSDDESGEPEQQVAPVPTLGQVAASRAKGALTSSSAPVEP